MTDRKTHWENIYQEKSPLDVSWYQKEPLISLMLIHKGKLQKEDAIIDVGGGSSVLVDFLYKEGFTNVSVLDISANALKSARNRLGTSANSVQWLEADITDFDPPQLYALWHDRAVFHFLTDAADRKKYVNTLKRAVKPGGHIIIATFAIDGPTKCSGLDIVQYDARKLMAELGGEFELLEENSEDHVTPDNKVQKFMYFRFIRKK